MLPSRSPRLLLIEDSDDDTFFFEAALKRSGLICELTHAADGRAALDILQAVQAGTKSQPDLLFLDLKLPVFSGFEVLTWIRDRAWNPPLRVIVLSGSEHARDVNHATALGAAGYVVKPISAERLKSLVDETPMTAETGSER